MMKFSRMASIMALALCLSLLVGVSNVALAQGPGCGPNGGGPFGDLSSEQREAILDRIMELRSQGATRQEIHTTVAEMLKDYGIEVPEDKPIPMDFGHGPGGFEANLTEEQREALRERVREMLSQGANREEIHTAIAEMLEGYGIEVPEDKPIPMDFGHGPGGFEANLTEEQREVLREEIEEMRGRGASDLEIQVAVAEIFEDYGAKPPGLLGKLTDEQRAAVQQKIKLMLTQGADHQQVCSEVTEMIEGYGIEVPDDGHGPFGLGHRKGGFMADLTDEQREAVQEKMKEMIDQGATPEETHTAVAEMLKGYGIEVPEGLPEPHGPFGFMADLTDEQREAVREKMKEMRDQGATREEIRAAVNEMLEEYSVKLSEDDQSVSSEVETAESHITAQSYPNPFNPEAEIAYTLSLSENIRIQIYNVSGQLIRTFDMGYQPAGSYSVRWDGRNESGDATASGVYLYRIEAGPYQVNNRMILLK